MNGDGKIICPRGPALQRSPFCLWWGEATDEPSFFREISARAFAATKPLRRHRREDPSPRSASPGQALAPPVPGLMR